MFKRSEILNKFFSVFLSFSIVFQSFLPGLQYLSDVSIAKAQEATESAVVEENTQSTGTPAVSESPTPEVSTDPTPTTEPSITEEPTVTPQLTPEPSPTPIPEDQTIEQSPNITENQPNAPPAELTFTPTPPETPTPIQSEPTPTVQIENEVNHGNLSAIVLPNISADSIQELDLTSAIVESSATLKTDKADYAPTDTVLITGTSLDANTTYILTISSSNPPAVNESVQITTDQNG